MGMLRHLYTRDRLICRGSWTQSLIFQTIIKYQKIVTSHRFPISCIICLFIHQNFTEEHKRCRSFQTKRPVSQSIGFVIKEYEIQQNSKNKEMAFSLEWPWGSSINFYTSQCLHGMCMWHFGFYSARLGRQIWHIWHCMQGTLQTYNKNRTKNKKKEGRERCLLLLVLESPVSKFMAEETLVDRLLFQIYDKNTSIQEVWCISCCVSVLQHTLIQYLTSLLHSSTM